MIKNSELIGTKVPAPWGWREFKVGDLFDNHQLKTPDIPGHTGYVTDDLVIDKAGTTPYLAAVTTNNGISGFSKMPPNNDSDVITLSTTTLSGDTLFYQSQPFIGRQQMQALKLKNLNYMGPRLAMYMIGLLKPQLQSFNYGHKLTVAKLLDIILELPVDQYGRLDYGWMSWYIRELEHQHIHELEHQRIRELDMYLQVTGLDNATLTDHEMQVLEQWRQHEKFGGGTLLTKCFLVGDLFELENSPVNNANGLLVGQVSAGEGLYGVSDMITTDLYDNYIITISKLGQTFYHTQNVTWTDDVLGLKLKYRNDMVGLFLSTIIDKQTRRISSYGHQFRMKRLHELSIYLPVTNDGAPDYDFMQTFIRAQEKLVTQRLDKFRQLQIDTTKAVI